MKVYYSDIDDNNVNHYEDVVLWFHSLSLPFQIKLAVITLIMTSFVYVAGIGTGHGITKLQTFQMSGY